MKKGKLYIALLALGLVGFFSSCDVPCGEGQLWVTNNASSTIYLRVDGYYTGYVNAGQTVKLIVAPDLIISYYASYGTANNTFTSDGSVTVDDCQTATLDLG